MNKLRLTALMMTIFVLLAHFFGKFWVGQEALEIFFDSFFVEANTFPSGLFEHLAVFKCFYGFGIKYANWSDGGTLIETKFFYNWVERFRFTRCR